MEQQIFQSSLIADQQLKKFCYLDARNFVQYITVLCVLAFSVSMFILICKKFYDLRHVRLNRIVKGTYVLLILWGVCYIIKGIFAAVLYQVGNDNKHTEQFQDFLSQMSRVYFVVDWGTVFILQHILILVPYNWLGKIIDIFQQFLSSEQAYKGIELKIRFAITLYLKLRFVIVPLVVVFVALGDQRTVTNICLILLSFLLFEAGLVIFLLILGLKVTKQSEKLQEILDEGELDVMVNQYLILLGTTFLRFAIDFWYVVVSGIINSNFFIKDCELDGQSQQVSDVTIMFQIIGGAVLTHFIPIIIVMRIYTVQKNQDSITSSLLLVPQDGN